MGVGYATVTGASHIQILLVRAVEESDPRGEKLPFAVRDEATRQALLEHPVEAPAIGRGPGAAHWRFLSARASRLVSLAESIAGVTARPPASTSWLAAAFAVVFALGALSHTAGLAHRFHLFAGPFFLLLLWNLVVLVALAWPRGGKSPSPTRPGLARRIMAWWLERSGPSTKASGAAATRFGVAWMQWVDSWISPRVAAIFHAASLSFALGLVAAVYARGLSERYLAGWDSTWLDAPAVAAVLGTVFRPAAWLTGFSLPENAAAWDAMRFSRAAGGGVDAGPWIHLHAVTLGLFAGIPRALLLLWNHLAARRAERRPPAWPATDPYFRRLLAPSASRGALRVAVVAYGFKSADPLGSGSRRDAVEKLVRDGWGARAATAWLPAMPYGSEPDWQGSGPNGQGADPGEFPPDALVVIFDVRATPEDEVHGQFLATVAREFPAGAMVVLELGDFPADRRASRIVAWQSVARPHGFAVLAVENGHPINPDSVPADFVRLP